MVIHPHGYPLSPTHSHLCTHTHACTHTHTHTHTHMHMLLHTQTNTHTLPASVHSWITHCKICYKTEPGIRRRNEDSCGNENRKLRKKIFSAEKHIDKLFFLFLTARRCSRKYGNPNVGCQQNQSWTVDEVIIRVHLHISSYFHDGSIWPVLIGQKSLVKPMNIDFAFKA